MARVSNDLETGLEWIAVNHADTLVPHTHMMLRGKDELGSDLVIAPDYTTFRIRPAFFQGCVADFSAASNSSKRIRVTRSSSRRLATGR
jgi:type IV secretory pathway VirD2 relaxase